MLLCQSWLWIFAKDVSEINRWQGSHLFYEYIMIKFPVPNFIARGQLFTDEECNFILANMRKSTTVLADVGTENGRQQKIDVRNVQTMPISMDTPHYWIYKRIYDYIEVANKEYYDFRLYENVDGKIQHSMQEPINYLRYTAPDNKYDWHLDIGEDSYTRKLSVIIQLSESDEYEGGDFQYFVTGIHDLPKQCREKASVIVFPSYVSHRITKVTKGCRESLVTWIRGPRFS